MTDVTTAIGTLHTAAIDSRNGYQEALEDAEGQGLTPLFNIMIGIHDGHASELAQALKASGAEVDEGGSFMSTVNRTIMSIRSLFGGLDESVLPGLIDGERRNIASYDDALSSVETGGQHHAMLTRHRQELSTQVERMQSLSD